MLASFAVCHFGTEYEINKIPPDVRAQMDDYDWIGAEWIIYGMWLNLLALFTALVALIFWFIERGEVKRQAR